MNQEENQENNQVKNQIVQKYQCCKIITLLSISFYISVFWILVLAIFTNHQQQLYFRETLWDSYVLECCDQNINVNDDRQIDRRENNDDCVSDDHCLIYLHRWIITYLPNFSLKISEYQTIFTKCCYLYGVININTYSHRTTYCSKSCLNDLIAKLKIIIYLNK